MSETKSVTELLEEENKTKTLINKTSSKKEDDNIIHTSFLETSDYILEQIIDAGGADFAGSPTEGGIPAFVKYSKLNDTYETIREIVYREKMYKPIINDTSKAGGVHLPTGVSEYGNTGELLKEISNYINEQVELPLKFQKFIPCLILFYWVYDKFPFVPYIHFVGRTATGKSTAMDVMGSLCYKSIDTTGSLTIASLFRIATDWRGTLLIDEFEKVGESAKEVISFLKSGVSDRLLFRTEGETKKEVKVYIVKSPKIFTSETPIQDAGLQSRTIVIEMEKNKRRLPLYRLPDDYIAANEIRNKLLLWRLRNLGKVDLKAIRFGCEALEGFDRRVQQVLTPIYYLAEPESKEDIVIFAAQQENETKRERRESIHGTVFTILCGIWDSGNEAQLKQTTDMFNDENKTAGYKNEFTEKRIANQIRKILGFVIETRGHDKNSYIVRDIDKENELRLYYGVSLSILPPADSAPSADDQLKAAQEIFDDIPL